jgi:hypothetical protein
MPFELRPNDCRHKDGILIISSTIDQQRRNWLAVMPSGKSKTAKSGMLKDVTTIKQ